MPKAIILHQRAKDAIEAGNMQQLKSLFLGEAEGFAREQVGLFANNGEIFQFAASKGQLSGLLNILSEKTWPTIYVRETDIKPEGRPTSGHQMELFSGLLQQYNDGSKSLVEHALASGDLLDVNNLVRIFKTAEIVEQVAKGFMARVKLLAEQQNKEPAEIISDESLQPYKTAFLDFISTNYSSLGDMKDKEGFASQVESMVDFALNHNNELWQTDLDALFAFLQIEYFTSKGVVFTKGKLGEEFEKLGSFRSGEFTLEDGSKIRMADLEQEIESDSDAFAEGKYTVKDTGSTISLRSLQREAVAGVKEAAARIEGEDAEANKARSEVRQQIESAFYAREYYTDRGKVSLASLEDAYFVQRAEMQSRKYTLKDGEIISLATYTAIGRALNAKLAALLTDMFLYKLVEVSLTQGNLALDIADLLPGIDGLSKAVAIARKLDSNQEDFDAVKEFNAAKEVDAGSELSLAEKLAIFAVLGVEAKTAPKAEEELDPPVVQEPAPKVAEVKKNDQLDSRNEGKSSEAADTLDVLLQNMAADAPVPRPNHNPPSSSVSRKTTTAQQVDKENLAPMVADIGVYVKGLVGQLQTSSTVKNLTKKHFKASDWDVGKNHIIIAAASTDPRFFEKYLKKTFEGSGLKPISTDDFLRAYVASLSKKELSVEYGQHEQTLWEVACTQSNNPGLFSVLLDRYNAEGLFNADGEGCKDSLYKPVFEWGNAEAFAMLAANQNLGNIVDMMFQYLSTHPNPDILAAYARDGAVFDHTFEVNTAKAGDASSYVSLSVCSAFLRSMCHVANSVAKQIKKSADASKQISLLVKAIDCLELLIKHEKLWLPDYEKGDGDKYFTSERPVEEAIQSTMKYAQKLSTYFGSASIALKGKHAESIGKFQMILSTINDKYKGMPMGGLDTTSGDATYLHVSDASVMDFSLNLGDMTTTGSINDTQTEIYE